MKSQKMTSTKRKRRYNSNVRLQQKEGTQSAILESAKNLFEKNGFDKATIRAIAARADLGVGTIFSHFSNKSFLLIAALLDDLAVVEDRAFTTLPKDSSIVDQCAHIAEVYYSYYAKRPSLSRTLLKESLFIHGEFGELLAERTDNFVNKIRDLMVAAQNRGEIAAGADCELAASAYFSFFFRHLFSALNESDVKMGLSIRTIRKLMDQYVTGLNPPSGT